MLRKVIMYLVSKAAQSDNKCCLLDWNYLCFCLFSLIKTPFKFKSRPIMLETMWSRIPFYCFLILNYHSMKRWNDQRKLHTMQEKRTNGLPTTTRLRIMGLTTITCLPNLKKCKCVRHLYYPMSKKWQCIFEQRCIFIVELIMSPHNLNDSKWSQMTLNYFT